MHDKSAIFVLSLLLLTGCSGGTSADGNGAGAGPVAGTGGSVGRGGAGANGGASGSLDGSAGAGGGAAGSSGAVSSGTGGAPGGGGGSEGDAAGMGGGAPARDAAAADGSTSADARRDDAAPPPPGDAGPATHNELILYDDDGRLLYLNSVNPQANWISASGGGRDLQLVGNGRVMLGKSDGWDEYRLTDGVRVAGQHGFAGTQSAHRLADGSTMLASVSGTSILLQMVDAAGQVQRRITYAGFAYVRLVRPTVTGTFLVTADTVLFEGTDTGTVLWRTTFPAGSHVWKAMRLSNGNTVAATGYTATLQVYDTGGMLIHTIGGRNQPAASTIFPWFYADFHVMPNGNYFVVNSQADRTESRSVQLLEYDTAGALVWQQKQPADVRSLEAAIVLDGLDQTRLYVETEGRLVAAP